MGLRVIEVLLSLLGLVLMASVSFISLREIRRTRSSIPSLSDFIKKGEDGEAIIREDVAMVIDALGSRMAKAGQMGLLQGLGADAKLQKGVESALAKDFIDAQLPVIGLVDDVMNNVLGGGFEIKKYLEKNPRALPYVMKLAGSFMGGAGMQGMKGLGINPMNLNNSNDGVGGYG